MLIPLKTDGYDDHSLNKQVGFLEVWSLFACGVHVFCFRCAGGLLAACRRFACGVQMVKRGGIDVVCAVVFCGLLCRCHLWLTMPVALLADVHGSQRVSKQNAFACGTQMFKRGGIDDVCALLVSVAQEQAEPTAEPSGRPAPGAASESALLPSLTAAGQLPDGSLQPSSLGSDGADQCTGT